MFVRVVTPCRAGLELAASALHVQCSKHSATLLPFLKEGLGVKKCVSDDLAENVSSPLAYRLVFMSEM